MSVQVGNAAELSTDDHFHCYLLQSQDPKYANRTYVGFTVNPWRRIRQHNGILKHGGARRTRSIGRPWKFAVVVHGFPNQKSALQFEWAWQHCDKSLAVRAVLGDDAAKTLKRKRALKGQLWILKTLVSLCPGLFRRKSLSLFFFDDTTRKIYDSINLDPPPTTFSKDWTIHVRVVTSLQDMPFWSTRNKGGKRRQVSNMAKREEAGKENIAKSSNVGSNHNGRPKSKENVYPRKHISCSFCHRPVLPHEMPVGKNDNASDAMHEICRDLFLEEDEEQNPWKKGASAMDHEASIQLCFTRRPLRNEYMKESKHVTKDQNTKTFAAPNQGDNNFDSDDDSDGDSYPSFRVDISDSESSSQSQLSDHTADGIPLQLSGFASMSISTEIKFPKATRDTSVHGPIIYTIDDDSIECIEMKEDSVPTPKTPANYSETTNTKPPEIIDLCSP